MQNYAKFHELPITCIEPTGWLRMYLEKQRDGLTGHLEAAGFPFNTPGWAAPVVKHKSGWGWWPYEQTGYWIDGMIRCGYLLGDDGLINKALRHIDYVLEHADEDGYLGPSFMKNPRKGNRWPHAVFFRAWMAYHSATGDPRIIPALTKHYLSGTADHTHRRNVCNVEAILWTYAQNGDKRLLDHARQAFEGYNKRSHKADTTVENLLSDKRATEHGVTFNEIAKLGALLYMYTGDEKLLNATINAYRKIDRDSMLVDGICSSTERLRGKDPLDSHETCDIADYTWSVGTLLMATGDAAYADKIERACFNAAPGAVRSDFKGLQYFSCPNQVVADATSNHNLFYRGHSWMSYRPNPGTECCPGEVNRIMPNYVARMWMFDGESKLVTAFYGPSRVTVKAGEKRQTVTIVEETNYPFSERIDFQIRTQAPIAFTLSLRIPGWCDGAQLSVNGEPVEQALSPGGFFDLTRTFAHNDRITLILPMKLKLQHWPHGGISLERGPLVYALRIEEDWRVDEKDERSTPAFPAWNLYPASSWNYALATDEEHLERDVEVVYRPCCPDLWSITSAPVALRVPARRVKDWAIEEHESVISETWGFGGLRKRKRKGHFLLTPQLPDPETLSTRLSEGTETVTLVPYGCTKLRITIFPQAKRPGLEA